MPNLGGGGGREWDKQLDGHDATRQRAENGYPRNSDEYPFLEYPL